MDWKTTKHWLKTSGTLPPDVLPDQTDEHGKALVHVLAEQGDVKLIEALHNLGANLALQLPTKETAFDVALDSGKYPVCRYLLEAGETLEPRPSGYNALDYPAMIGDLSAVEFLLSVGAYVDGQEGLRPPLVWAVQEDQPETIALLLGAGASPFVSAGTDFDDQSAIELASAEGQEQLVAKMIRAKEGKANEIELLRCASAIELAEAYGFYTVARVVNEFVSRCTGTS